MERLFALQLLLASAALSCAIGALALPSPQPPPPSRLPARRSSPPRRRAFLYTLPPPPPPHRASEEPSAGGHRLGSAIGLELLPQQDVQVLTASSQAASARERRLTSKRPEEQLSASFQLRSTVAIRHPMSRRRRSMSHLPHVNVTVRSPDSVVTILIPLGHEMTTYGALSEAEMLYGYRHPTLDNAFAHRLEKLEDIPCWGVAAIGDVSGSGRSESGRWHVRVTDQLAGNRVLHSGICLPRGSALKMRTHFLVEFYLP